MTARPSPPPGLLSTGLLLVVTPDSQDAERLQRQLRFFCDNRSLDILCFPDWETLPYDRFSPHQDIISERLLTLQRLPGLRQGILLVPVATLLQRLPGHDFIDHAFDWLRGVDAGALRGREPLDHAGDGRIDENC